VAKRERAQDGARPEPSDLELQILATLWERGPSTAREVLGALPDGKDRAYTSVLSVMQVMQKKGLLAVGERRGLANVYEPAVSKRQVLRPLLHGLVQRVFGGSPAAAVEHLLDANAVSEEELAAIRALLARAEPDAGWGAGRSEGGSKGRAAGTPRRTKRKGDGR